MRPSLKELEDTFWLALFTGISSAGALLLAPNLTGIDASAFEAAQGAFLAGALSVVLSFSQQQLQRRGVEVPRRTGDGNGVTTTPRRRDDHS